MRLAILLLATGAATLTTGCGHQLKLARPEKVGDRFGLSMKGHSVEKLVIRTDGTVTHSVDSTMDVDIDASAEVLAVDDRAQATRMAYRIERSTATTDGSTHEVLPAGTIVTVEEIDGKTAFRVDGQPLPRTPTGAPPAAQKELALVINSRAPNSATDDDIFGSTASRKVGESWPVNSKAAAADFSKGLGSDVNPATIKGRVTLLAEREEGGTKGLELEGTMDLSAVPVPLPPGYTLEEFRGSTRFWGVFPVDLKLQHRLADTVTMDILIRATAPGPDGKTLSIEEHNQQTTNRRFRPAAP